MSPSGIVIRFRVCRLREIAPSPALRPAPEGQSFRRSVLVSFRTSPGSSSPDGIAPALAVGPGEAVGSFPEHPPSMIPFPYRGLGSPRIAPVTAVVRERIGYPFGRFPSGIGFHRMGFRSSAELLPLRCVIPDGNVVREGSLSYRDGFATCDSGATNGRTRKFYLHHVPEGYPLREIP